MDATTLKPILSSGNRRPVVTSPKSPPIVSPRADKMLSTENVCPQFKACGVPGPLLHAAARELQFPPQFHAWPRLRAVRLRRRKCRFHPLAAR